MLSILIILALLFLFLFIRHKKRHIKGIIWVIVVLVNLLAVEVFAYGYFLHRIYYGDCFFLIGNQKLLDQWIAFRLTQFAYIDNNHKNSFYQPDSFLGYTVGNNKYLANWQATNSYGMRSDHDYTFIPSPNTLRVATFGDSYVFCDGERTQDTWPYFLEKSMGNLDVLNFGVSGYGLGQSYLRYLKDGLRFNPDILFINYTQVTSRDIISGEVLINGESLRNSSFYRAVFWMDQGLLKSRAFTLMDFFSKEFRHAFIYKPLKLSEDDSFWSAKILSISNVGLFFKQIFWPRELRKKMVHFEPDLPEVNYYILKNLLEIAQKHNTVVLFFSMDLKNLPEYIKALFQQHADHVVYAQESTLNDYIASLGLKKDNLLNMTNHYNSQGNHLYAEVVARILASQVWGKGNRVFQYNFQKKQFENMSLQRPSASN